EQFSKKERAAFAELVRKGQWSGTVERLSDLAGAIRKACCVVSADSGPAHLAAQLGVRTLALFGPTDASIWAPVGPAVRTLAPPAPTPDMSWLQPETVLDVLVSQQWIR
ncbi:MAG TPA: glycosyltransferase family 9 protein, partial [Phycisphaerales bacterium]|nr:glycosyltransferase family 9 protein [Phycisphaerales bacterium]